MSKLLDPATDLLEIQRTGKHVNLPLGTTITKVQIVVTSTGKTIHCLYQIRRKKKKTCKRNLEDQRRFRGINQFQWVEHL